MTGILDLYYRAQQELVEKERREVDEKKHQSTKYAEEVRQQIRSKEQQRISDRQAFYQEGVKLDEEARQRRQKLDDIKRKKLAELRCVLYIVTVFCHLIYANEVPILEFIHVSEIRYTLIFMIFFKLVLL